MGHDVGETGDTDEQDEGGELCEEGYCMIDRCAGDLSASTAPLGNGFTFRQEDEIALADSRRRSLVGADMLTPSPRTSKATPCFSWS